MKIDALYNAHASFNNVAIYLQDVIHYKTLSSKTSENRRTYKLRSGTLLFHRLFLGVKDLDNE